MTAKMEKLLFTIVAIALVGAVNFTTLFRAAADEIHHPICLVGCPSGTPASNDLIIREIYLLSSNDATKFADWVAYVVLEENFGPSRSRTWKPDPLLDDDETLEPEDYTDANDKLKTDRGHQVPLASFAGTEDWRDTNFLSNITPQKSDLNQGPWVALENEERRLARLPEVLAVYVQSGPLYEGTDMVMPGADEPHEVPSGYWKVLAIEDAEGVAIDAYIFDQNLAKDADFRCQMVALEEIEERSGLVLYTALDAGGKLEFSDVAKDAAATNSCDVPE